MTTKDGPIRWNPQGWNPQGKSVKKAKKAKKEPTAKVKKEKVALIVEKPVSKSVIPLEVMKSYQRVPDKKGKIHVCNGDAIARMLMDKELGEVYKLAAKEIGVSEKELHAKYSHLNIGMQRMNLGNRLRKVLGGVV